MVLRWGMETTTANRQALFDNLWFESILECEPLYSFQSNLSHILWIIENDVPQQVVVHLLLEISPFRLKTKDYHDCTDYLSHRL